MKRNLIKQEFQKLEQTFRNAQQSIVNAASEDSRVVTPVTEQSKDGSEPARALSLPMNQNLNSLAVGDAHEDMVSSKRTGVSLQQSDKELLTKLEKQFLSLKEVFGKLE